MSQSTNEKLLLSNQNMKTDETLYQVRDASGKSYVSFSPSSFTFIPSRHIRYNIGPTTAVAAGQFSETNPYQFRLQPGLCSDVEMIFLNMICKNTDGTNSVTPVVAPYLINRIEIGFNGSPSPVTTIYADEIYALFQFYSQEQVANLLAFNQENMTSTAFAGESAIAANGLAYYSVPLISVLNKLNLLTISSDIILNVYLRSNPVSAGTGTLTIQDLQLRILTRKNDLVEKTTLDAFAKMPAIHDYSYSLLASSTLTLTAGVMSEIPLNGVSGCISVIAIMIKSSKAVAGSAIRTFTSISGTDTFENTGLINIVDSSHQSVLGSGAITGRDSRGQSSGFHTPGVLSSVVPIYFIYPAENPVKAVVNGENSGYLYMNGNHFLQLTPSSTFTTGTYTVDVICWTYGQLIQERGLFRKAL